MLLRKGAQETIKDLLEAGFLPTVNVFVSALMFDVTPLPLFIKTGTLKGIIAEEPEYKDYLFESAFLAGNMTANIAVLPNTLKLLIDAGLSPTDETLAAAKKAKVSPEVVKILQDAMDKI